MPQKMLLCLQYLLICSLKCEYFDWRQNLSFSSAKSYLKFLPLIKFRNPLKKMDQILYGNAILRNINVMFHCVTFSSG